MRPRVLDRFGRTRSCYADNGAAQRGAHPAVAFACYQRPDDLASSGLLLRNDGRAALAPQLAVVAHQVELSGTKCARPSHELSS